MASQAVTTRSENLGLAYHESDADARLAASALRATGPASTASSGAKSFATFINASGFSPHSCAR